LRAGPALVNIVCNAARVSLLETNSSSLVTVILTLNTDSIGALATTMMNQAAARATDVLRTLRIVIEVMG